MYYFSNESILEIEKIVNNISFLFISPIKEKLINFIAEIKRNKKCNLEEYQEVLSMLDNKESNIKKQLLLEKKNNFFTNSMDYDNAMKELELLNLLLISNAFVTKNKKSNENEVLVKEVKNEIINNPW